MVSHSLSFDVTGPTSAAFPTVGDGLVETRPRRMKAIKDKNPSDDEDDDCGSMDENTSNSDDGDSDNQGSRRGQGRKRGSGQSVRSGASKKPKHEQHADEVPED